MTASSHEARAWWARLRVCGTGTLKVPMPADGPTTTETSQFEAAAVLRPPGDGWRRTGRRTAALPPDARAYPGGRSRAVDAMLLGTVLLWALNITVTRYMILQGWSPLAYATVRYFLAILLFVAYTYHRERSFRIERGYRRFVVIAGLLILANQICFVYSLKLTNASTVALLFGATPMFIGVVSTALGLERLGRAFWFGALITMGGVALIALASGSVDTSGLGVTLGIFTAATWGCYTVAIAPLMRRYSPFRISALVLPIGWVPLALLGAPQLAAQHFSFGWPVWLGFAYAVVGPLFLTNVLWFTAIDRVGPSRASLFGNLEPFFAVVFALLLLSESLTTLEVIGGALIFAGIGVERVYGRPAGPVGDREPDGVPPRHVPADAVAPFLE
jgi:drug/metabolite transporter (DMT)-like permease